jgi:hypothetical protein
LQVRFYSTTNIVAANIVLRIETRIASNGKNTSKDGDQHHDKNKTSAHFLALVFDGKTLIDRATHSLHQAFAAAELLWLNWIMKNNLDRAR